MNSYNPSSSHVTVGQTSVESELLRVPEITSVTSATENPSVNAVMTDWSKNRLQNAEKDGKHERILLLISFKVLKISTKLQRRGATRLLFIAAYK